MQRLKVFLVTVIKSVLAKLKRLAIHIVKHPLGSIWWTVKMYFALMFFSLFVACSFGAFAAETPTEACSYGTVLKGVGCGIPPKDGTAYKIDYSGKTAGGASAREALDNLIKQYTVTSQCNGTGTQSVTLDGEPILSGRTAGTPAYYTGAFNIKTSCTWTQNNPYAPGGKETQTTSSKSSLFGISIIEVAGKGCDFESALQKPFNFLKDIEGVQWCVKPFDEITGCFADPKYSIANQYHFAPQDAGKGKICVDTDNIGLCPFVELPDSKGVFVPARDETFPCDDKPPSDPMPPPEPPENCTTTPTGMKVCKEDPNEKCTANSSNAMSCPPSCGYMNNVFLCFENPDVDPEQPEEPDVPRPPADDDIENPEKPIADMLKKDFKDVQRGVETRLDGFAADMANLIKAEKSGNDQLVKNSAQGNKLLNSINQNTADTVKELKKLSEPGEKVEGIEKPEFEEKNDWQQRNFGTVMKAKGDEIMNLPIMQSISNFFDVSFSGSCPTYAVTVWVFEINIDQFCSPQVQALFPYISAVVLLMCSFFAIRIALL